MFPTLQAASYWTISSALNVLSRTVSSLIYWDQEAHFKVLICGAQSYCAQLVSKLASPVTHCWVQKYPDWPIACSGEHMSRQCHNITLCRNSHTLSIFIFISLTKPQCPRGLTEKGWSAQRCGRHGNLVDFWRKSIWGRTLFWKWPFALFYLRGRWELGLSCIHGDFLLEKPDQMQDRRQGNQSWRSEGEQGSERHRSGWAL